MARATRRACSVDVAPSTVTSSRVVAPSPSRAICLVSDSATEHSAASKASSSTVPATPLAMMTAVSLVEADHALLQQAMHNLVENAVKYTDPGGQVQVRVYQDRERMVFEVIDSGIGIAPVDIPLLFKKFSRAGQKEAKKRPGSGLGLAIVKSVVERHQGQVWVESQLGKGSTFFFAIPFRQPSKNTG